MKKIKYVSVTLLVKGTGANSSILWPLEVEFLRYHLGAFTHYTMLHTLRESGLEVKVFAANATKANAAAMFVIGFLRAKGFAVGQMPN